MDALESEKTDKVLSSGDTVSKRKPPDRKIVSSSSEEEDEDFIAVGGKIELVEIGIVKDLLFVHIHHLLQDGEMVHHHHHH